MKVLILAALFFFASSAGAIIHVPFTVTVESINTPNASHPINIGDQYNGFVSVESLIPTTTNVPGLGNLYIGKAAGFYFEMLNVVWDSTRPIFGGFLHEDGKRLVFQNYLGPCTGATWCTFEQRSIWGIRSDVIGFILEGDEITAILGGANSSGDAPWISMQGNTFSATPTGGDIRGSVTVGAVARVPEPSTLLLLLIALMALHKLRAFCGERRPHFGNVPA